jgi:hypothetical protein
MHPTYILESIEISHSILFLEKVSITISSQKLVARIKIWVQNYSILYTVVAEDGFKNPTYVYGTYYQQVCYSMP